MAPEAAAENIRVVCRFRPLNSREKALGADGSAQALQFDPNGRSFWVGPDKSSGNYSMDAVLKPASSQEDMYRQASGIVESVLKGYNGTILAYGQTGSGKTHSIMGDVSSDREAGVLPRAVRHIFESICADTSGSEFVVSCSYLEIYKESVRDLLQPASGGKAAALMVRESRDKGVFVEDLTEVFVTGEEDILDCLSCGNANRIVGSTLMNSHSSRSHALLTINLQQTLPDGTVKCSKLNVADLAGSEKVGKTGAAGDTLDEAKKINASLSSLCLVIASLAERKPHVPYRNSKLTRILQESLGGNSKTMLLVTCSPAADNAPETHSSLRFAMNAKTVQNVATVNKVRSKAQLEKENAALQEQLNMALAQVDDLLAGGGSGGEGVVRDGKRRISAAHAQAEALAAARLEMEERAEQLAASQAELHEEKEGVKALSEKLAELEGEAELIRDMLERYQVLHGFAPLSSKERRAGRLSITTLRRQLIEVEALALQQEMGELGAGDEGGQVDRLKAQLAEQRDRIRELERFEEQAAKADAAQQEVVLLKAQLHELAQSKMLQLKAGGGGGGGRSKSRRLSVMPGFRATEKFGQHILKRAEAGDTEEEPPPMQLDAVCESGESEPDAASIAEEPAAATAAASPSTIPEETSEPKDTAIGSMEKELQLERSRSAALERTAVTLRTQLDGALSESAVAELQRSQERAVERRLLVCAMREAERDAVRLKKHNGAGDTTENDATPAVQDNATPKAANEAEEITENANGALPTSAGPPADTLPEPASVSSTPPQHADVPAALAATSVPASSENAPSVNADPPSTLEEAPPVEPAEDAPSAQDEVPPPPPSEQAPPPPLDCLGGELPAPSNLKQGWIARGKGRSSRLNPRRSAQIQPLGGLEGPASVMEDSAKPMPTLSEEAHLEESEAAQSPPPPPPPGPPPSEVAAPPSPPVAAPPSSPVAAPPSPPVAAPPSPPVAVPPSPPVAAPPSPPVAAPPSPPVAAPPSSSSGATSACTPPQPREAAAPQPMAAPTPPPPQRPSQHLQKQKPPTQLPAPSAFGTAPPRGSAAWRLANAGAMQPKKAKPMPVHKAAPVNDENKPPNQLNVKRPGEIASRGLSLSAQQPARWR